MKAKIVEAVGVSANSIYPVGRARAAAIELAMANAVLAASAAGITDPAEVRAWMMKARELVITKWTAPQS